MTDTSAGDGTTPPNGQRQVRRDERIKAIEQTVKEALKTIHKQVKVPRYSDGSVKVNGTAGRAIFATLSWVLLLIVGIFLGAHAGNFVTGNNLGIAAGSVVLGGLSGWVTSMTLPLFIVSVPEAAGWVLINLLTGYQRAYGTGWHFKYPWEQAKEGNVISLRNVTQKYEQDYPAQDGPKIETKWSLQYVPVLAELPYHIAVDETTIREGFGELGSALLSSEIAHMPAEEARRSVEELQQQMLALFEKTDQDVGRGKRHALEQLYGINLLIVSLADSDYEERYQRILTTQQISAKVKAIAAKLREENEALTPKDALNAALIMNGNVTKQVIEAEGEGGQALASLLLAIGGAGRNTQPQGGAS